jgi:hypothetical protein
MHTIRSRALTYVTSYSACIAEAAMRAPQRGSIHSVFKSAANIIFPRPHYDAKPVAEPNRSHSKGGGGGGVGRGPLWSPSAGDTHDSFVLSLNAVATPRMPNGLQLSSPAGSFPFSALRVGMPVIFGAQRLHIEAIDCSLDLSQAPQWNPHIQRPDQLDMALFQKNYAHLKTIAEQWFHDVLDKSALYSNQRNPRRGRFIVPTADLSAPSHHQTDIFTLAHYLCGRGIGLTPSGDDILAGWMAAGWLLYGPEPAFLAACQHIVEIARQQTHILSSCWLSHAAEGNVAEPIAALLHAMTRTDDSHLESTTKAVLAMGANSGYDLLQGILLASFIRI